MTNTQNNQVRFTADTTSLKAETMTTTNIIALDRIASADETRCGGKAWNCARMKQAGFPVPDGLVVLATATPDELNQIGSHPWFDSLPAGTLFAVRSSGIGEDGSGQVQSRPREHERPPAHHVDPRTDQRLAENAHGAVEAHDGADLHLGAAQSLDVERQEQECVEAEAKEEVGDRGPHERAGR